MISPVSTSAATAAANATPQTLPQAKPAPPAPDTVHISPQGVAASRGGDIDHDGDSR